MLNILPGVSLLAAPSLAELPRKFPMPALYIVIADFNGFDRTRHCLRALAASTCRNVRVIVVDHGTSDETRRALASEFPEVIRVAAAPELWWTGATNCGIRHALALGAEGIILLNNDCYVEPEAIGEIARLARERPDAIIAPVQRDLRSGKILSLAPSCCFLLGFPSLRGPVRLTPELQARGLLPVRLIAGGRGVFIPVPVLRRVGEFDEQLLPHYGADHDFYLRARKQGVPLFTATNAMVNIDNTSTSLAEAPGRMTLAQFRETLRSPRSHRNLTDVVSLFRKHYPVRRLYWLGASLYILRYVLIYMLSRLAYLLRRR